MNLGDCANRADGNKRPDLIKGKETWNEAAGALSRERGGIQTYALVLKDQIRIKVK